MTAPTPIRGRYAPSPTGELHLGNASSALLAWLSIRSRGGTLVMRVEDLDRARSRDELTDRILDDMRWLGLDWDEGPDLGGPYGPYIQSQRGERYRDGFRRLLGDGRLYPCFCSRAEIAAAAGAPQGPIAERRYPGRCRSLDRAQRDRRLEAGARHAWRFRVELDDRPQFVDLVRGSWDGVDEPPPDDFVIWRSDGVPAYQLAVVIDDAAMRIDEVVRGDDLLSSTPRQLLVFDALDARAPRYAHVPLLLGPDGTRLSKRHGDIGVGALRRRGIGARRVVGTLAWLLGLRPTPDPLAADRLLVGFDLRHVQARLRGIEIDPASLF